MSASGPLYKWSLPVFLLVNALSAWYMVILDCDETFNYLEPLHHMIYGYGFQTWEYSPRFALRPYSFLLIFAGPIRMLLKVVSIEKVTIFKIVRLIMGTMSAFAQKSLVDTVAEQFGQLTASYLTVTMACSTGFFIASSAFLPNTFAMILFMNVLANWMRGKDNRMLMMMGIMGILSWPYALLCCIIPALISLKKSVAVKGGTTVEMSKVPTSLQVQLQLRTILLAGLFSIIYLLIPTLFIEHSFYGRWTFPSLNAVLYNMAGRAGGPDLFGTEPWYYYLLNLGLNFSVLLPVALLNGPLVLLQSFTKEKILLWANMFLSLMIFSMQNHKEERFLFALYPLICLNASMFLSQLRRIRVHLKFRNSIIISI
jgi:alpha-1,2-mannosyltransferase